MIIPDSNIVLDPLRFGRWWIDDTGYGQEYGEEASRAAVILFFDFFCFLRTNL